MVFAAPGGQDVAPQPARGRDEQLTRAGHPRGRVGRVGAVGPAGVEQVVKRGGQVGHTDDR